MTDQIYHQVQYPMKKAISLLKKVDLEGEDIPVVDLTEEEKEELRNFLNKWEEDRARIVDFVTQLRQISRTIV
ncbi:hypothetical protein BBF96_06795 [Anoxybacter fermentans]|uniref:Uncharacterized protein n=1 Tax=Anoxybacter fermentans TaxID=1323375 RepID=A0A3S9SXR0_9FIRM|nr:hypothetical protein [Anoxybacter fermentans]AZR73117.1 hypothetical protein BBF96_06795 [Anoxybacter fermentans]